jgi:hypothetical protein
MERGLMYEHFMDDTAAGIQLRLNDNQVDESFQLLDRNTFVVPTRVSHMRIALRSIFSDMASMFFV